LGDGVDRKRQGRAVLPPGDDPAQQGRKALSEVDLGLAGARLVATILQPLTQPLPCGVALEEHNQLDQNGGQTGAFGPRRPYFSHPPSARRTHNASRALRCFWKETSPMPELLQPVFDLAPRRLLVMARTATKRDDQLLLPAGERYDGRPCRAPVAKRGGCLIPAGCRPSILAVKARARAGRKPAAFAA
jgi:hypothetical protein